VLTAMLFTMPKIWNEENMLHIHNGTFKKKGILSSLTKQMNLKDFVLSEISQAQAQKDIV
jgi:hypothetical protein